ncbi:hypothetical protein Airi01_049550 [Actinoallomurus iriomotensis]|uniref:Uncharacterized protein n=1 Tax=Actinoallomurus iriomotensis TaxID=478107 RepID=A0A9W6VLP4_9ACTN|nr:hypothetical protein Airi01_049550 [Actinoallomurus iriomotensis]
MPQAGAFDHPPGDLLAQRAAGDLLHDVVREFVPGAKGAFWLNAIASGWCDAKYVCWYGRRRCANRFV